MNIWRLVAYHNKKFADEVIEKMIDNDKIAIGWSEIGDLNNLVTQKRISEKINEKYPTLNNNMHGGASLIRFYSEMDVGDLVVITNDSKKICVFEIIGDYFYSKNEDSIYQYNHQRNAVKVNSSYEKEILNLVSNLNYAEGENQRWTIFKYDLDINKKENIFEEGRRYKIQSNAIERSYKAREECLKYHEYSCKVCNFNFFDEFGDIGKNFIHVHHKNDISLKKESYRVNPIKDLIPLCPNCHAMAHKKRPAYSIEELKEMRSKLKG